MALDAAAILGSAALIVCGLPQLYRILHTRSAHDLSWLYLGLLALGLSMWVIYGVGNRLWFVVGSNAGSLLIAFGLLAGKWVYGRQGGGGGGAVCARGPSRLKRRARKAKPRPPPCDDFYFETLGIMVSQELHRPRFDGDERDHRTAQSVGAVEDGRESEEGGSDARIS